MEHFPNSGAGDGGSRTGPVFNPDRDVKFKHLTFDFEQVVAEFAISDQRAAMLCSNLTQFHMRRVEISRELIARLTTYIPSMGLDVVRFPSTWWDAFKERWFPKWALKRWPADWTAKEGKALFYELHKHFPMPTVEEIQSGYGNFRIAYLPEFPRDYDRS